MKKKISFLLSLAIAILCISTQTAFAINETTSSTNVSLEFPFTTTGGEEPSYSYKVNIPARSVGNSIYSTRLTSAVRRPSISSLDASRQLM